MNLPTASWETPDTSVQAPPGRFRLTNGELVGLRPIDPHDRAALRAFHAGLSEDSVRARYFGLHPTLPDAEFDHMLGIDGCWRVAFVAVQGDRIVGIARYDRGGLSPKAEVAFIVADEYQGRGLAGVLLEQLAARALASGILELRADVLFSNQRMLNVFRHAGFREADEQRGAGVIRVRIDLRALDVAGLAGAASGRI